MSRKSQAFAQGQPAFSWKVEKVDQGFKCTCRNHPHVSATGDTEQHAINAAKKAMETAVDKVDNQMVSAGNKL
jgi:hypothetical protein